MYPYAQTNIQLYNQLLREGYSKEEIGLVFNAYSLAIRLFTGLYRPSGNTFVSHLVGTASILASLRVPINLVTAGLLHAAYIHGDFGIITISPLSNIKRKVIRDTAGEEVEEYIARYTGLKWSLKEIPAIRDRLDRLSPIDRDVLLIRLANELEDNLNLGALYCSNAERRKPYLERCGPIMVDMAEKLGFPILASELTRVLGETASAEITEELRSINRPDRAHLIPPKSYQKRLPMYLNGIFLKGLSRLRKSFYKMR